MTIKETLIEAKRYDEVMELLTSISKKTEYEYPLFIPYRSEDNNYIWRVKGDIVREEARLLINYINHPSNERLRAYDLKILHTYVNSESGILLHNYAIRLSHKRPPEVNMEKIRIWLILENMIINLNDEDDEGSWTIPDGWKRKSSSGWHV